MFRKTGCESWIQVKRQDRLIWLENVDRETKFERRAQDSSLRPG
jgi:hypothetical protein